MPIKQIQEIESVPTYQERRELIDISEAVLWDCFTDFQDLPNTKNYRALEKAMLDYQHAKLNVRVVEREKHLCKGIICAPSGAQGGVIFAVDKAGL